MNTNLSQNRALAILGIVAIILGLGVGLLWAGVGSSASDNPSAPIASNQSTAQNPSTTATPASSNATPADNSAIPTVITSNTGEAAPSGNNGNNAMQPTPTDNSATSNSANGNTNPATSSGSTSGAATNGTPSSVNTSSSTPTSVSVTPKHKKTTAKASGTPTAGKGNAKGKASGNTTAGKNLGNQVAVAGVVESVDAANKLVVLDTNFGPLSATLATTATILRQPLPGDTAATTGPIDLSSVQVGNYAIVLVNRSQLPQPANNLPANKQATTPTPGASGTPGANDQNSATAQAKNRDTLLKRKFGVGDGFSATVSAMRIGPAPASIAASDSNRLLGLRAIPAAFVALNSDGSLLVTITKYGNLTVIVGPGTRFDRLGQPIAASDLKPGDSLILYGEAAWIGTNKSATTMKNANSGSAGKTTPIAPAPGGKGTGKGPYANGLPVVERIAELHIVTTNEHVLQGKVTSVNSSANTFLISSATNETFTVTVAADTMYQSLALGQSISSLTDLQPGNSVVVYTIGNNDIDPTIYNARTVELMPATK